MCGNGQWAPAASFPRHSHLCLRTAPSHRGGTLVSPPPAEPFSIPPGGSSITHRGAAAPGCGQEPCSLLLLQGGAAADPAGAERAQDQPVLGARGAGLLPAVSLVPPVPAAHGPSEPAPGALGVPSSPLTWPPFSRELLNEERVPSFFLDAMKSTIKRQRKKIRAKMLGTTESESR